ncbi:MAG: branched-chain amino acid ABC transporter permease [Negativicutes bacterium]|nr:branched-chain amino acid ABC transporter permease [Negativicutes bacterium]
MLTSTIIPAIIHGLIIGGIYGGIALGLSLIFGVLRITNFAHGSVIVLAAFAYYWIFVLTGINPYIAIPIVATAMFVFGYVIQNLFIYKLLKRERASVADPISALMLTVGLWILLDNLALMLFGPNTRTITTFISEHNVAIAGTVVQTAKILAFFGSFVLAGLLVGLLYKTEIGRLIRSVSQNRDAASLCGVNVRRIYSITFGLGCAVVSVSAAMLMQFYYVSPSMGQVFGIKSFLVVILGGLGSIPGALLGGLIFGLVESVGGQFIASSSASMLSFGLFIIVLLIRPNGLFGRFRV